MYKATLICDADVGVLASREDKHPADDLALRAWQKWREKGSSSTTCENVDMDLVDDYIRKQTVAPFFLDFTDFIYEHNILFGVVTQRMDRIVETILRRAGLERVPVFANHVEVEPFTIRLSFPYFNRMGCDHCSSCNLYHLSRFRRPGVPLIFVGERGADYCAARSCDLVFARGELRARCEDEGLPCHAIANLRDVERILAGMICQGELERLPRREEEALSPSPPAVNGGRGGSISRN